MAEEHPRTKALRDFLVASPHDSDRKWAEYVALAPDLAGFLNPKSGHATESSMPSSPPTRSTASPRVLSSAAPTDECLKRATTEDNLTPGARRLYDLLVGDSISPASTAPLHAPNSSVSSTTPAAAISDSTSTRISMSTTTPAASASRNITKDDLSPGARRIYDLLVGGSATPASAASEVSSVLRDPTTLDVAPIAVDIHATELAAMMPTNCSSECSSHDADVPVSVLISSAAQTSSTTIGDILSELAAPMSGDKALDVNAMCDTPPTDAICLQGVSDHSTDREDPMAMSLTSGSAPTTINALQEGLPSPLSAPMGVPKLFRFSPSTCSTDCSGRNIDMPPRLLAEDYKVFNDEPIATAIIPWPPPSYTHVRPILIQGHDLFHNKQQKRGKEFLVVWVMRSSLPPPVQDVQGSQGKHSAIWFEVAENRHPFERIEVVKLKPPWLPPLGLCMNLPTVNVVLGRHSPTLIDVGLRLVYMQLEQLTVAKFAARMYTFAHMATLHHHFSSGNLTLLSTVATNSAMVQYIHYKGPPDPDESDCVTSRYFVDVLLCFRLEAQPGACAVMLQTHKFYSTRLSSWKGVMLVVNQWVLTRCIPSVWHSFEMELVLGGYDSMCLTGHFIQRAYFLMQWKIPWLFSSPILGDWFLVYPTRKAFLSSFEKIQGEIARSFDMAIVEWKTWTSGVSSWAICLIIFAGGPVVPIVFWLQFAIQSSFDPQDELHSSNTIGKLHDLLVEMGIYSRPSQYLEVHILDAILIRFRTPTSLHAGKSYWLLGLYSSCDQFVINGSAYFGSQHFDWQIPWYFNLCHAISLSSWLRMQPIGDYWKFHAAFLFSWDVSCTIGSEPSIMKISGMFNHALQFLEVGNYFAVAILLLSSHLSQVWVLYLPTTSMKIESSLGSQEAFCASTKIEKLHALLVESLEMQNFGRHGNLIMQIAVQTTGLQPTKILYCSLLIQLLAVLTAVLPLLLGILSLKRHVELKPSQFGGVPFLHLQQVVPRRVRVLFVLVDQFLETSSMRAKCVNQGWCPLCLVLSDDLLHGITELTKYWDPGGFELQLPEMVFLIMSWDLGGSSWCRLGVKPNFKEGGLSATSLLCWLVGRHSWAMACSGDRKDGNRDAYIPGGQLQGRRLGTERKGGFGRGLG